MKMVMQAPFKISAKQAEFLEKMKNENGISRAQSIRAAIDLLMEKTKRDEKKAEK
jgi:hypothetical protein